MKTSLRVVTALSLCLSLCLVALRSAGADDFAAARQRNWHHWRGPDADGVAPRAEPPVEWSRENGIEKNIQWKIPVPGEGSSTPIVWEERIFLLTAVKTERVDDSIPEPEDQPERPFGIKFPRNVYRFVVLCIDRASGKVMWERTACERVPHEGRHPNNSFASGSPTTDGERLYASRQVNAPGRPGSPRPMLDALKVPASGVMGSLINSAMWFFRKH